MHGSKQEEFTLQQGVILNGCRVLISEKHRTQILRELHFWSFRDSKNEGPCPKFCMLVLIPRKYSKKCTICAIFKNNTQKENFHYWKWSSVPWQRIHNDYFGPFKGKMLFLVVDAYSKWPEVFIVPSTTTSYTIQCLSSLFARYGYTILL